MATHLKVGGTQAYQAYREVEPVPPYPRIDPQRPRNENSQPQSEQREDKSEPTRRRFDAMRSLIDELMQVNEIGRVDYQTAVNELTEQGFLILEAELLEQLSGLKFSAGEINGIIEQLSRQGILPDLQSGRLLAESRNFFPVFISGLSEYSLCFPPLHLSAADPLTLLTEKIESQGYYIVEKNRLRIDFRPGDSVENSHDLIVTISVLVGGSEIDDGGRRVILYPRPDRGYSLYADKQINLSI